MPITSGAGKKEEDEITRLLHRVADHFIDEDKAVRERQIRHWRQLKLYWANFSQIYWSDVAHDYRIYDRDTVNDDNDQEYYDRPINVFRAFLETIIAALSIQIPAIQCIPDDAENPDDLSTAKAGDKVAAHHYKQNDVILLWLKALYIYCTEGLIAFYNYTDEDEKYGIYREKKYREEEVEAYVCPLCEVRIADEIFTRTQRDRFDPDIDDVELLDIVNLDDEVICPYCGEALDPNLQKSKITIRRLTGTTKKAKSRVKVEVFGGLYVKIANYARCQGDTPYLIYAYETNYVNALEDWPKLWDNVPQGGWSNQGLTDPYEQFGRLNTQYRGEYPDDVVTCQEIWLRPAAFNVLSKEESKILHDKFPAGAKICLVNDICADHCPEKLDDHWTLTQNPLTDYLNHDPAGELLTNVQDVINDLISLTLQTVEHGIPQTWADPAVVDFAAQRQIEAQPGTISPTKTQGGNRNIGESFYSNKAAALAPEVLQLFRIMQELGQFVSGAMPSLFGGSQGKGASKTASEYAMSKGMALQRLQTPWRMLTVAWKQLYAKVIPATFACLVEDERFVEKDDKGNFLNVWVRTGEIQGRIGDVDLEAGEQIPITEEQQRDMILEIMQMNNPILAQALTTPENLNSLRKVIRIPQFRIPGEDDRIKQLEEIELLINSTPIAMPPTEEDALIAMDQGMEPQPTEMPSVQVDPIVDNHQIEADTCRAWLVGPAGRLAKTENPDGYLNVLLHMKEHMDIIAQRAAEEQMAATMANAAQQQNSGGSTKKEPLQIKEQSDALAPVG